MSEQETPQAAPQAVYGPGGPEVWVMHPNGANTQGIAILHAVSGEQALVETLGQLRWVPLASIEVRRVKYADGDIGTAYAGRVASPGI